MSLWDIKERLEYLCDSTFSVKRGLNELCKNPTRRVLCHFTIRRCVWLQLKKKSPVMHFWGYYWLSTILSTIFSLFSTGGLTFRSTKKMDHDFPVINCTIISIHPNHENYSCQKLICAKVAFYTLRLISISGISIRSKVC